MQFNAVTTASNDTTSEKRSQQRRQYTNAAQQRHYVQLLGNCIIYYNARMLDALLSKLKKEK